MRGEALRERGDVLRLDRETGGRAMAPPAPEQIGAGTEAGMEIERRDGASRPFPVALAARDEHHGTVEALDETRRHDADHALVPVLPGDDVRTPAAVGLRPRLHDCDRLAQDAAFDRLALTVQLLELVRERARLLRVVRQQQLERG